MPTALIVEDEPEANKLLGMLIKLRGYRSTPAFTGGEALEQLGRQVPDILFLDLMLPDVDGYEICRAVKSAKATCLIPLVIVSARIAQRNRIDSFHAGADEFISKPYTPERIFEALEQAEALREQASREIIKGSIRFVDPDDDLPLHDLARLRSLILGRTPLEAEVAGRINGLLDQAWRCIVRRPSEHPDDEPGSVHYELTPDRLVLSFRDGIAWFEELQKSPDDPFVAGLQVFDEVSVDRVVPRLTLIKRWA
ncbi:PleD family two-component system response regulator [Planctomyces sp. SH-PL62]|uniref:response regulator n=1 Tax=Planctomyces sp. SH-PL62 TaxID=1636152 RepID=UPI00078B718A|nr:response regulator [Planctomyces sp. SH-PL62]AMV39036.1 Transcriptional regulatory protein BaeR [Planctomyces sp. SH-PL62]